MTLHETRLLIFCFVLASFGACQKAEIPGPQGDVGTQGPKGDTGTQGPKGDTGTPGTPGSINAYSYIYPAQQVSLTAEGGSTNYDPATKRYTYIGTRTFMPDKYRQLAESGLVMVYLRNTVNPQTWTLSMLQGIGWYDSETGQEWPIDFTATSLRDQVVLRGKFTVDQARPTQLTTSKVDVKIILIEPTTTVINALRTGTLDPANSQALENYLRISQSKTN